MLKRDEASVYIFLAVVCAIFYGQTLPYAFVYDDVAQISKNPLASDFWNITQIFSSTLVKTVFSYRPLTLWSFAMNRELNVVLGLNPFDPFSFHFVNLVLHFLVCCLAYRLLIVLELSKKESFVAVLLFAALPIHTEVVTSIVGRAESIAAVFGLLFLLAHHLKWPLLLPCLFYMGSMFGKESGITFLGVAVALESLFPTSLDNGRDFRRVRPFLAYGTTAGIWLLARYAVFQSPTNEWSHRTRMRFLENPTIGLDSWEIFLNSCQFQMHYLIRSLFPFHLASDSSYDQIPLTVSLWHPATLLFLGSAATLGYFAWTCVKKNPWGLFLWLFYFITFSITSNFVVRIGTVVGERLIYTPSLALCVGMAILLFRSLGSRPALWLASVAGLALCYGGLTIRRNFVWKDEMSFFAAQVADAPRSAKAHYNYATLLARQDHDNEAIVEFEKAISIYPNYQEAYLNLTNSLAMVRADPEKIQQVLEKSVQLFPNVTVFQKRLDFLVATRKHSVSQMQRSTIEPRPTKK